MSSFWSRLKRNWRDFSRPKLALELCLFEEGYSFNLFNFFVPLPILNRYYYEPKEIMESWGISYFERSIYIHWGNWYKFIHMPWSYDFIKCDVLRPDGTWVPVVNSWEADKEPDGRMISEYPYKYTLRSGEVQERTATVYVDRREWRQLWLKWCPWFAKVRQSIDVRFNDEVGERTGSWKGGCIGCGYDMRKGETPEQTLRRMESERTFG